MVQGLLNLLEVCTCRVRMTVRVDRLKTSLAGVPTPEACMMTGNGDIRYCNFFLFFWKVWSNSPMEVPDVKRMA